MIETQIQATKMKSFFCTFLMLCSLNLFAAPVEVNQEHQTIKALSDQEINGFLKGKGMGQGKPAELNNYPGPRHVMELSNKLNLTGDQLNETQKIFKTMQSTSIKYGELLIKKEMEIENMFHEKIAESKKLEKLITESAILKSKIRYAHLVAHIQQKALLTDHQIHTYNQLRAYVDGEFKPANKHHHH